MNVMIAGLWPAIALACGLGLVFAALGGRGRATPSASRIARALAVALWLAGALAAWLQLVRGQAGIWLDAAILILCAYGIGCLIGAGLRGAWRRRAGAAPAVTAT